MEIGGGRGEGEGGGGGALSKLKRDVGPAKSCCGVVKPHDGGPWIGIADVRQGCEVPHDGTSPWQLWA